mmetsp:Transcript_124601/g.248634  ORF Transcript_124601/g.248634 Transcript_124601/m.248634 type:complete len:267 (+) Transcript_124601:58-858(+)
MRSWLVLSVLLHHRYAGATLPLEDALPRSIGVVGVGTIGSAVARGILSSQPGHLSHMPNFVLSPRNAQKSKALNKEFPNYTRIATNDQGVVDGADCIILAVPGSVAAQIIKELKFRSQQQVVSLVAAVNFTELQVLLGPGVDSSLAVPLPAVAKRQGATLGFPSRPYAKAIFSALGTYVAVENEDQYKILSVANTFMGDFYKRQLTMQQWMAMQGVDVVTASAFIGAIFKTIAADSADAGPSTFQEKLAVRSCRCKTASSDLFMDA